jgi:hypothetical protein
MKNLSKKKKKNLRLIEIITEFDGIMQHIQCIEHGRIQNHYLGHNIQNDLINLLAKLDCTRMQVI